MADTAYSGPAPDFHSLPPRKAQKIRRQTLTELRAEAEAFVEHFIAVLDTLDGDSDLEPTAANPAPYADEAEPDHDDEPDNDNEPSLGSLDRMADQHRWAHGDNGGEDAELDDSDREPSLGSLETVGQVRWGLSGSSDREWNGDDPEEDRRNEPADTGAALVIDQTEIVAKP